MSVGKLALIFESYLILNVSLFSGLPKTIRKPAMHSLGYAGAKAIPQIHFKPCYDFKTMWLQTSVAEGLLGQRQGLCNPTCAMSGHGPLETSYMWRDQWLMSSGDVHTLHSHHAKVTHSWKQGDCHMHPEVGRSLHWASFFKEMSQLCCASDIIPTRDTHNSIFVSHVTFWSNTSIWPGYEETMSRISTWSHLEGRSAYKAYLS